MFALCQCLLEGIQHWEIFYSKIYITTIVIEWSHRILVILSRIHKDSFFCHHLFPIKRSWEFTLMSTRVGPNFVVLKLLLKQDNSILRCFWDRKVKIIYNRLQINVMLWTKILYNDVLKTSFSCIGVMSLFRIGI